MTLVFGKTEAKAKFARVAGMALDCSAVVLSVYLAIACGISVFYVACTVNGLVAGYALPTTAAIIQFGFIRWLATYDYVPVYGLLFLLACTAAASWVGALSGKRMSTAERAATRLLVYCGPFLACSLYVLSVSGAWSGLVREGDIGPLAIAGLVPFSDAGGHLASAQDFFKDHVFDSFALRRPWAAAARTTLLAFGGLSYSNMITLQALLLAVSACFAGRAIYHWRGAWAAGIFVALMFIVSRSFLTSSLTEGIGLIWALLSIPFLVTALRLGSLPDALVGFALVTISLMTRMGAMFLIPALGLWIFWRFGETIREKITVGLSVLAVIVGVLTGNFVLEKLYAPGETMPAGNFSYTLCSLSVGPGTDWSICFQKYEAELKALSPGDTPESFIYRRGIENIRHQPGVLFTSLEHNFEGFVRNAWAVILKGYDEVSPPRWFRPSVFVAVAAIGLFGFAWRRREIGEFQFWSLVAVAMMASASVVWQDDGRRVLSSGYPLLAALACSGFVNPKLSKTSAQARVKLPRVGLVILAASVLMVFFVPISYAKLFPQDLAGPSNASDPNTFLIYGGRRITGILVISDGAPRPPGAPSVRFSDFARVIAKSRIEEFYHGLVHPKSPELPFAFIEAPRMEKDRSGAVLFIAPPELLTNRRVSGWRLKVTGWQSNPGEQDYWYLVTHAEPLRLQGDDVNLRYFRSE